MVKHPISPVWDKNSKILILGSFPSVKSRETGFFYGHPQNRFWPVLAEICGEATPTSVEEKRKLALRRGVALWDVIAQCRITGSSDASISDVVPNDLSQILAAAGKKTEADEMMEKARAAAEKKGVSNCPLCAVGHAANRSRIYKFAEMDADHVTAWTKGGATDIANCQMLCKTHNRAKGNR